MKKYVITKCLSILIIFVAIFSFIPAECKAEDNSQITMKVSYGINGSFKSSIALPINVEIENNGEAIDGQVEIRVPTNELNTYDAFIAEIKLASKEKRTVTIPINVPENSSKVSVVLTQKDKVLKENTVVISTGRINENSMFMGTLTDDFDGLTIRYLDFTDPNNKDYNNKISSIPIDFDLLSKSPKNISQLDVIVINNYNVSNLKKNQYDNLSTWINNGGILIIGSGENSSKTIANIDKEFLDITYSGTKDVNNYTLANLSVKDPYIKLKDGENPLIYSINKGKGKIYISTFDLANKNIASKENVVNAWKEYLSNDLISKNNIYERNGVNIPYEFNNLSNNIPIKYDFSIGILIAVFSVYALLIGIILYFIMKKLNKRESLWGVIPAIAIFFSLLLYFLGGSTRIQDLALNQVNVIVTDKNGSSEATGYLGIGSRYKNDLVVEEPAGSVLQEYDNRDNYRDNNNIDISKLTKLGTKVLYEENNSCYEFKELPALRMKKFEIFGHKEIVPKIEVKLNYNSQKLTGNIKNTLGYDIKKLLIVSSNNVWDLGKLNANEDKATEVSKYFGSGLQEYGVSLKQDYYNNYKYSNYAQEHKEEFKDILRIGSLIRGIGEEQLLNKEAYLIAITDMPIDYGFDFGKKSISKYDTTAIIQNIDIDYTDTEGNLCYPFGYFEGHVEKSDSNVHVDDAPSNRISGSGDLILNYSVDKDINLLDLKVGYIEDQNQKARVLKGNMYIFNYEKNDYDRINYAANGESLSNPNQYISDGKVTIKLNCNEEKGAITPEIAVKGRAK